MRSPLSPLIPYILMNILTLHRAKVNTMRGRRGRIKKIVNFTACRETRHAVRGRFGFSGYAASPALPGCGARIARCSACALRPLPLLRRAASAAGGARLCSSLRFPTITKKCVLMPERRLERTFLLYRYRQRSAQVRRWRYFFIFPPGIPPGRWCRCPRWSANQFWRRGAWQCA